MLKRHSSENIFRNLPAGETELFEYCKHLNDDVIISNLRMLLRENYGEIEEKLRATLNVIEVSSVNTLPTMLLPSLHFLLFSRDLYNKSKKEVLMHRMNRPNMEHMLKSLYELPSNLTNFSFVAAGTSSFIIRCGQSIGYSNPSHRLFALKLIHFRYGDIEEIANTNNYPLVKLNAKILRDETLSASRPCIPMIFEHGRNWILMNYIEGLTLRDFIDKYDGKNIDAEKRLEISKFIIGAIIRCLEFTSPFTNHLDLTPENIIVSGNFVDEDDVVKLSVNAVTLIDFGANYLIQENIIVRGNVEQTELYAAPEVIQGKIYLLETNSDRPGLIADVFSLGTIILSLMRFVNTHVSGPLTSENKHETLNSTWKFAPNIAKLLEDMIDQNSQFRLLLFEIAEPNEPTHLLEKLKNVIDFELDTFRLIDKANEHAVENAALGVRHGVINFFERGIPGGAQLREARVLARRRVEYKDLKVGPYYFVKWSSFALLLWALILISAIYCTALEFDMAPMMNFLLENSWFKEFVSIDPSERWQHLPGRAVAVSFGLVAARYYMAISATLSARGISEISEFWIRVSSFSFFPPVMYAIIVNPHAWPVCSAIGLAFVAAHNLICWNVARKGIPSSKQEESQFPEFSTISAYRTELKDSLDRFYHWWRQVAYYALALFILGIALYKDIATDEWIFALFVILINVLKMYHVNSLQAAPEMKGMLHRLFFSRTRAKLVEARPKKGLKPAVSEKDLS